MSLLKNILIVSGTAILAGTAYLTYQYKLLKENIALAFTRKPRFILQQLTFKQVKLKLIYTSINPGILSATITACNLNIYLNGGLVGHIVNNDKVPINSKKINGGITVLQIPVDFAPKNVLDGGLKNIDLLVDPASWDNLIVSIRGTFSFESSPLTGTIPLDISFSLSDVTK